MEWTSSAGCLSTRLFVTSYEELALDDFANKGTRECTTQYNISVILILQFDGYTGTYGEDFKKQAGNDLFFSSTVPKSRFEACIRSRLPRPTEDRSTREDWARSLWV